MTRPFVFFSYSNKNEQEKNAFLAHLAVLDQENLIELWSDDKIGPGLNRQREIQQAIVQARVAILLITVDYLTTDFIRREEIPALLQRNKKDGLTILPVIARNCAWRAVDWLTKLNIRPQHGQPVWREQGAYVDLELATIAEEIVGLLEEANLPSESLSTLAPETIMIPAGQFQMGSDEPNAYEVPQHTAYLDEYHIGKYPITNKQFFEFVQHSGHIVQPALRWNGQRPPENKLEHPVAGVTWHEALTYCQWLSQQTGRIYTLPSEAQWEKAARGTDGRLYPWGNSWQDGRCNPQPGLITSVSAYPAQNEYGCYDMVGNVREWTSTLWGYHRAAPDPAYSYPWVPDDGRDDLSAPGHLRRVYRGGMAKSITEMRCSHRDGYMPNRPGPRGNRHGFRVMCIPAGY